MKFQWLFDGMSRVLWALLICMISVGLSVSVTAQDLSTGGTRFSKVLPNPVVEGDLFVQGNVTWAWNDGDTTIMLVQRFVKLAVGGYAFNADQAVIAVTEHQRDGQTVKDIRMYLDKASEVTEDLAVRQRASFLFVTATVNGNIELKTDKLNDKALANDALVKAAYQRFALFDSGKRVSDGGILSKPGVDGGAVVDTTPRGDGREIKDDLILDPSKTYRQDGPQDPDKRYVLFMTADRIINVPGEKDSQLVLIGRIKLIYYDTWNRTSRTLKSDKAVIFGDKDVFSGVGGSINGESVKGVYLEDNVILVGQNSQEEDYTIRAPRVYFDLQEDRAVVLNAVMYSWEPTMNVPIYIRAKELRQESNKRWTMKDARLTTSEFGVPHFAVGVDELVIERQKKTGYGARYYFEGYGTTMQVMGTPIFWFPFIAGEDEHPVREVGTGLSSNLGGSVGVVLGLFELFGVERPFGVDATLRLDGYFDHGPAVGLNVIYDVPMAYGHLDGYFIWDFGPKADEIDLTDRTDKLTAGREERGYVWWQHKQIIDPEWEVTAEVALVSDSLFLDQFFPDLSTSAKRMTNSLEGKYQEDEVVFTAYIEGEVFKDVKQILTLQQDPYYVNRIPELSYFRVGTPLLGGRVQWYSDNSLLVFQFQGYDVSPGDIGFNNSDSLRHFGITNTTSFEEATQNMGLDDDLHVRFDTRQEFGVPFTIRIGGRQRGVPIHMTPYVVGRVTAYDDEFSQFSSNHEQFRLWGALGVRVGTAFYMTHQVDNELLDIHGLQHIIEPSVDMFYAETNVAREYMPRIDQDVESISEGGVVRLNLRNILKTKRGPRDAGVVREMFRLDTSLVVNEDRTTNSDPMPYFIVFRPEYSQYGPHARADFSWLVTDSLQFRGNAHYDFDREIVSYWNLGWTLQLGDMFTSTVGVSQWREFEDFTISYGFRARLNSYYDVGFNQSVNLDDNENPSYRFSVIRRLPRWEVRIGFVVDEEGDTRSLTVNLVPEGLNAPFNIYQGNLTSREEASIPGG